MASQLLKVNEILMGGSLKRIPQPPKQLHVLGAPLETFQDKPRLAVVGSRKVTLYGHEVTNRLVRDLIKYGFVIVSGLALGVDGLAHQAALAVGGLTIAVLPGGLDKIYPASHHQLAQRIIKQGGALISEYPEGARPHKHHFIARNRLIAALSDGVLITEAAAKSGSLYTAQFALEQGLPVFAVPGNITSGLSDGTNELIKQGATPVTSYADIINEFSMERVVLPVNVESTGDNPQQTMILRLIEGGERDSQTLLEKSGLSPQEFNQNLTMLEITGQIKAIAGGWTLG
jgi:DNA processing protein